MKKLVPFMFGLFVIVSLFTACTGPDKSQAQGQSGAAKDSVAASGGGDAKEIWTYEDETDKMTSKITHKAQVVSTNALNLQFPYNDDNDRAHVTLRKQDGEINAWLYVDKGQFIYGLDSTTVRIRFDQDQPLEFACGRSSDASSNLMFILDTATFIKQLKKSKKMIIEATFYQDGAQQMEFDTAGLKWND